MTNHAPTVFTAEKLSFSFPGKQVLDAVDFSLHAGTITCLLGGNGAGKTPLFKAIYGLLPPWNADAEILYRPSPDGPAPNIATADSKPLQEPHIP